MAVARGLAAIATILGSALVLATPASASPVMSGHYVVTVNNAVTGQTTWEDWYFTPCGDGCASVRPWGHARLADGQWSLDTTSNALCRNDITVFQAEDAHYMWNPDTLAGTVHLTGRSTACGRPLGYTFVNSVQFSPAP